MRKLPFRVLIVLSGLPLASASIRFFVLLGIAALGSMNLVAETVGRDHNDALRTAYRSDLIGPEMWTVMSCGTNPQQQFGAQASPKPGLVVGLYIVHATALGSALTPDLSCGGKPLTFAPVGNAWTPAYSFTRYRAAPSQAPGEPSFLGDTVYLERKCITTDNVFVAEGVLRNAGASSHVYRVAFKTHKALPRTPGVLEFTTEMMGAKTPRKLFAAPVLPEREITLAPNAEVRFRYALALSPESAEKAKELADATVGEADPFAKNAAAYNAWMDRNAPALAIDDESVRKLYDYRWFLVWRAIHDARRLIPDHPYPRLAAYESPMGGWYNCVIGLPVPMQIQELAWMRDPQAGFDHILNWRDKVKGYREHYIQFIGMTVWRFLQCHPDRSFAASVLGEVVKDADRHAGKPDALPVQYSSWPTGAEYQPNFYQFTEPKWDFRCDGELRTKYGRPCAGVIRLDTVGFAISSLLGAANLLELTGDAKGAAERRARAAQMIALVRKNHWDEKLGLFLAADPKTGKLADEAACYDSFVPYMFGMETDSRYFRAFDKFCSPEWFWDAYAITTVAKTCPMYAGASFLRGPIEGVATPEKPHPYGCCWNGPVWHFADSLMAEAFGQVALREPARRGKWLEFFRNWNETHFPGGDRSAPRAAEHFRPEDGRWLGGTYDYFHSSWLDPFYRFWCGISVNDTLSEIRFEPFSDVDFELRDVPLAGRSLGFSKRGKRLEIRAADGSVLAAGEGRLIYPVR